MQVKKRGVEAYWESIVFMLTQAAIGAILSIIRLEATTPKNNLPH